jgi:hypothetical protein
MQQQLTRSISSRHATQTVSTRRRSPGVGRHSLIVRAEKSDPKLDFTSNKRAVRCRIQFSDVMWDCL